MHATGTATVQFAHPQPAALRAGNPDPVATMMAAAAAAQPIQGRIRAVEERAPAYAGTRAGPADAAVAVEGAAASYAGEDKDGIVAAAAKPTVDEERSTFAADICAIKRSRAPAGTSTISVAKA
jgi:hypothetical protein